MIPIRILLVEDAHPVGKDLERDLASYGNFDLQIAFSAAAGMLLLARLQPDVLVLNPHAGRGSPEEWRRTIECFRHNRPLAVLVLTGTMSRREGEGLSSVADIGLIPRRCGSAGIRSALERWLGTDEILLQAA
jgi:hypothetical protein